MKTSQVLKDAETTLRLSGVGSPRLESELLMAHVLGCTRVDLYGSRFDEITKEKASEFLNLIKRRSKKEPVAYLLGRKEFMELSFQVSPATLIPRPETELLVLAVEKHLKNLSSKEIQLLDIGTGSGCIALSLAHRNPSARVTGIDFSEKALAVAKENAKDLNLSSKRVSFLKRNALEESFWNELGPFEILVSNPPYIGEQEASSMESDVLDYEPSSALFAEHEGLAFYECFAKNARKALTKEGLLFLELSPIIYNSVIKIFEAHSWKLLETIKDYAGHKRHIILS